MEKKERERNLPNIKEIAGLNFTAGFFKGAGTALGAAAAAVIVKLIADACSPRSRG
jgi:hypothetical protein